MSGFTVRHATKADAAAIARVHIDSWRVTYRGIVSDEYLASLSYEERTAKWAEKDKASTVFVAENGGKITGFANIGPARKPTQDKQAEIYAIYLIPAYVGQGIGRALFQACVAQAKKDNFSNMAITVMSKNLQARNFYERMDGTAIPDSEKLEQIAGAEEKVITYLWENLL